MTSAYRDARLIGGLVGAICFISTAALGTAAMFGYGPAAEPVRDEMAEAGMLTDAPDLRIGLTPDDGLPTCSFYVAVDEWRRADNIVVTTDWTIPTDKADAYHPYTPEDKTRRSVMTTDDEFPTWATAVGPGAKVRIQVLDLDRNRVNTHTDAVVTDDCRLVEGLE
jgi:hypothetical protein